MENKGVVAKFSLKNVDEETVMDELNKDSSTIINGILTKLGIPTDMPIGVMTEPKYDPHELALLGSMIGVNIIAFALTNAIDGLNKIAFASDEELNELFVNDVVESFRASLLGAFKNYRNALNGPVGHA